MLPLLLLLKAYPPRRFLIARPAFSTTFHGDTETRASRAQQGGSHSMRLSLPVQLSSRSLLIATDAARRIGSGDWLSEAEFSHADQISGTKQLLLSDQTLFEIDIGQHCIIIARGWASSIWISLFFCSNISAVVSASKRCLG